MPLFCALGGFHSSEAVALSNVTIVGGAIANFIINIQRRHPTVDSAPLVDWALILVRGGGRGGAGGRPGRRGRARGRAAARARALGRPLCGRVPSRRRRAHAPLARAPSRRPQIMEPTTILGAVVGTYANKVRRGEV
jgi:hypothetical protein